MRRGCAKGVIEEPASILVVASVYSRAKRVRCSPSEVLVSCDVVEMPVGSAGEGARQRRQNTSAGAGRALFPSFQGSLLVGMDEKVQLWKQKFGENDRGEDGNGGRDECGSSADCVRAPVYAVAVFRQIAMLGYVSTISWSSSLKIRGMIHSYIVSIMSLSPQRGRSAEVV